MEIYGQTIFLLGSGRCVRTKFVLAWQEAKYITTLIPPLEKKNIAQNTFTNSAKTNDIT